VRCRRTDEAYEELSHNTAVNDLIEKVVQAIQDHDQEMLDYGVQQADSLRITDRPEMMQGTPTPARTTTTMTMTMTRMLTGGVLLLQLPSC
jgi:phage head maturation protease